MAIIKMGQPLPAKAARYVRQQKCVFAVRVPEPFVVETWLGKWLEGQRGDWLIEIGNQIRFPVQENRFLAVYEPYDPAKHGASEFNEWGGDERRNGTDRRRNPPNRL